MARMKIPKPKRKTDPHLLRLIRELPCTACGRIGPSDPHHVTSVGAGGGDIPENVMPLCRRHHADVNAPFRGLGWLVREWPSVREWLVDMGREDVLGRLERWDDR